MVLGVSTYIVHSIIHDQLYTIKVSSRWVPHLLTPDQRHKQVQLCQELLAGHSSERNDFLFRIITGDESLFFITMILNQNHHQKDKKELIHHPHQPNSNKKNQLTNLFLRS